MDALKMTFETASFDLVIDKGTMDAIMVRFNYIVTKMINLKYLIFLLVRARRCLGAS